MSQDTAAPPTVSAFMEQLRIFEYEVGCDGKKTGSHSYPSRVVFRDENWNTYRLKEIEPEMHMGCGCWVGIGFVLERVKDDDE